MRALADRFPGALRELDRLPMETVEARILALRRALTGHGAPSWAAAQSLYHRLFRACLRIKREASVVAAAEHRGVTVDDVRRCLERATAERVDDRVVAALLPDESTLLRPARGRLHPWVIARVADHLHVAVEHVEAAFHPA